MALRIKSKWHHSERNASVDKGLEEHAGALAFIMWRMALDKAVSLHGEDYVYTSDGQRIAIICEYLAFQLQICDRLCYLYEMPDDQRQYMITNAAQRVADHVQDNAQDLFGPGDYKTGFLNTLNKRSGDYAEYSYTKAGPSYSFLRYLGARCQSIMKEDQLNKWVINQVMEKDGPEVNDKLGDAFENLLGLDE